MFSMGLEPRLVLNRFQIRIDNVWVCFYTVVISIGNYCTHAMFFTVNRCQHLKNVVGHMPSFLYLCIRTSGAQKGSTPLIDAAASGHADCVRLLLEAGAQKDAKDSVCIMLWLL